MKHSITVGLMLVLAAMVASCATAPPEYYNTQRGAAIGAAVGGLGGQIIGGNTEGTLIGAAVGTLLGAVLGNAADQQYAAAREAYATDKRVVYYDDHGGAVEALPGPRDQNTQCRKITKRVWNKGTLVSETVEEICEGRKSTSDY